MLESELKDIENKNKYIETQNKEKYEIEQQLTDVYF